MSSPSSDITNYPAQDPMLALIERAARDPTFSVEKLESLLRLQVEQQKRVAIREFILDQNAMQLDAHPGPTGPAEPGFPQQIRFARGAR